VSPPNTFTINQAANSVTVKADQSVLRQVKHYIDQINYAAGRRVAIRMDIYDINLSALGQRSFDFDIKNLLADANSLKGFITDFAVAGSSQVNTQSAPTSFNFRVDNADNTLNGATALLRVLRGKGAVTKRTAKEFVVSNNEQVNEIRTRITPYVSGVTVDQTTLGITQSNTPTIETKEANTGTAIQLHPTISGDRVYIQMTIEDSSLVRFDDFEFGGGEGVGLVSGKLPVTEVSQSQYEFALIDGETIAVAGSITSARAHEVVNGSLIPILGDSVDKNETRTQSLIFVTSNILD
jgi:type II secretory pathway component GspD/PulD (secretin)